MRRRTEELTLTDAVVSMILAVGLLGSCHIYVTGISHSPSNGDSPSEGYSPFGGPDPAYWATCFDGLHSQHSKPDTDSQAAWVQTNLDKLLATSSVVKTLYRNDSFNGTNPTSGLTAIAIGIESSTASEVLNHDIPNALYREVSLVRCLGADMTDSNWYDRLENAVSSYSSLTQAVADNDGSASQVWQNEVFSRSVVTVGRIYREMAQRLQGQFLHPLAPGESAQTFVNATQKPSAQDLQALDRKLAAVQLWTRSASDYIKGNWSHLPDLDAMLAAFENSNSKPPSEDFLESHNLPSAQTMDRVFPHSSK